MPREWCREWCREMFPALCGVPFESAAHRDKSREWGRLNEKVEPLLTFGNSGKCVLKGVVKQEHEDQRHNAVIVGRSLPPFFFFITLEPRFE